jgi:integrase
MFVRVSPAGKLTFAMRYLSPVDFKDKTFTLRKHGDLTLTQAQKLYTVKSGEVANGVDIQLVKNQAKSDSSKSQAATFNGFIDNTYEPAVLAERKSGKELIAGLRATFKDHEKRPLTDFTKEFVTQWRVTRIKAGVSKSTINRNVATLKAMLNKAVEFGVIEHNPMAKLKQFKIDTSPNTRYLSAAEEADLREALKEYGTEGISTRDKNNALRQSRNNLAKPRKVKNQDHKKVTTYKLAAPLVQGTFISHIHPIVLLAINTGMRRGEIFTLTWQCVDTQKRQITVLGEHTKSGKTRHIPMNNEAVGVIERWRAQSENTNGIVFPNPKTGERLVDIKKRWKTILEMAGINDFRFHDLRHTFASKLVMKGVPLNTVRELLGHASLDMTLRYAHLDTTHKANAVDLLNN